MSRLNLRKRPRVCYYEPEEPAFDEYVYCTQCRDYVYEYCSIHGPLLVIPDDKVPTPTGYPPIVPRAALTIPRVFLHLAASNIPGAGIGVFSTLTLPSGVRFGPYRGVRVASAGDSYYGWQIYDKNHKPSHIIDARDDNNSNWMRYVNCSRHDYEQNLVAYQYKGQLYYRTIKIIPRFTELLVFYGSEYARLLSVYLRFYKAPCPCADCQAKLPKKPALKPKKRQTQIAKKPSEKINAEKNPVQKVLEPSIHSLEQTNTDALATSTTKPIANATLKKPDLNVNPIIKFQCDKCSKTFDIKSDLEKHIHSHTLIQHNASQKEFVCKSCESTFNTKSLLLEHMKSQHGINYFACAECDYKTVQKCNLLKHQRTHTKEKPYKCSQCIKAFSLKNNLVAHQRIHTGEKPYKCSQCSNAFSQKNTLELHQRTHTGEKPYKCSQCSKAFSQKHHLVDHQRIHTGEQPYICSQCSNAFSQKNNLERHQRIHTGEKPYKCSQCSNAFSQKNTLELHQRTHTGEKPYKCSQCSKAFSQKHHLVDHQRIHTGEKPYICSQCSNAFSRKNTLERHQRIHRRETIQV